MQSISFYKQRLSELLSNLQNEFNAITEDGVIDYDEAIHGRAYIQAYQQQLHDLKATVHSDIKETRSAYKLRLMDADKAHRRLIREERADMLDAYNKVIHLIDRMLLDVKGSKRTFLETLGEFKMEEQTQQLEAVKSESEVETQELMSAVTEEFEESDTEEVKVVKLTVTRDELLLIMNKWQQLSTGMEAKLNQSGYTPEQLAQFVGARNAFSIAVEDIKNLLTIGETHEEVQTD